MKPKQRVQKRMQIFFCFLLIGVPLMLYFNQFSKYHNDDILQSDLESETFFSQINSTEHPNCREFLTQFSIPATENADMDLAFTLVVHRDILQIARLLRMIHRKNNYYCIYTDLRSRLEFENALEGVAACFGSNVELVPKYKRVVINWGDESLLQPQLICGEQALQRHGSWKYLLNIVGQDFPLKTNLEIVATLRALNGSNLIEGEGIEKFKSRTRNLRLPLNVRFQTGAFLTVFIRQLG